MSGSIIWLMNRLTTGKRMVVIGALVEGNSVRSTCRMTGVSLPAVLKLLADMGAACARYQDEVIRGVRATRIQVDEIWQFCYAKAKNVPEEKRGQLGYGDVWTWVAIDADTKLVPSWRVGPRDVGTAYDLMRDLSSRLANRVQLTTDGLKLYIGAVEDAFGGDIDYSMLVKLHGASGDPDTRCSPAKCIGCIPRPVTGDPDPKHVSTSYVERQNLTMRMSMRRLTRLTNGFSKKVENHAAAVARHYQFYNFARIHQTLRVTPAMAAGIADHVWSLEEIVGLLEQSERNNRAA